MPSVVCGVALSRPPRRYSASAQPQAAGDSPVVEVADPRTSLRRYITVGPEAMVLNSPARPILTSTATALRRAVATLALTAATCRRDCQAREHGRDQRRRSHSTRCIFELSEASRTLLADGRGPKLDVDQPGSRADIDELRYAAGGGMSPSSLRTGDANDSRGTPARSRT